MFGVGEVTVDFLAAVRQLHDGTTPGAGAVLGAASFPSIDSCVAGNSSSAQLCGHDATICRQRRSSPDNAIVASSPWINVRPPAAPAADGAAAAALSVRCRLPPVATAPPLGADEAAAARTSDTVTAGVCWCRAAAPCRYVRSDRW